MDACWRLADCWAVSSSSFCLLRTQCHANPPALFCPGPIQNLRRLGNTRLRWFWENGCWLVFHLMIAGRLHWKTKTFVLMEEAARVV